MLFKLPCPPNTPLVVVKYRFLEPTKLEIGEEDAQNYNDYVGRTITYCFGIGDIIEVFEPRIQFLSVPHERLKKIPIVNKNYPGGIAFIFNPPETIKVECVVE